MEQISLEDKVSETLGWLANQIACIQVYKKWDEEFKKKSLNDAWQKVQEQFKKDIDWNALTESQCKALHFLIVSIGTVESYVGKSTAGKNTGVQNWRNSYG